jgi:hypothetical protein
MEGDRKHKLLVVRVNFGKILPLELLKVIGQPTLTNLLIFQNQWYFISELQVSIEILAHL